MNLQKHFKYFDYYLIRWALFGAIGGLTTPVLDPLDMFWTIKGYQLINGLMTGFICAVIFTPIQNNLNNERSKYKTWLYAFLIWTLFKFAAAYLIYIS